MKKILMIFIVGSAMLFAASQDQRCLETMAKLLTLQNRIVKKSFETLKPGTWARYNDRTLAIYLGPQPEHGETLYGIEFQNTQMPVSQIWYAIVPKTFIVLGKKVTLFTLDPRIAYLDLHGMIVRVDKGLIDLYLDRMRPISIGLTPAYIENAGRCVHDTVVTSRSGVRLQGGKSIDVSEIADRTTGGMIIVSDEVPFGYVRTGPFGSAGTPVLIDFGYAGYSSRITEAKRRMARPAASFLFAPGRMRQ